MSCPICEKRPPKRFCPAKGERICAICCGTHREVTIDCLPDCVHLISARRYELEHRKPQAPEAIPFPNVEFSPEILRRHPEALSAIGLAILGFAQQNSAVRDPEILGALRALAEAYRTLESGIYFERPPDAPMPRALYEHLGKALQDWKKQESQQSGFTTLKDSEIFRLLVFILRAGTRETSDRPKARAFLDFLYAQFPAAPAAAEREAPRIILP
ncbi:MAG: hypothetical protein WA876_12290 [Candidatus Acidiferrales bacterium]